MNTLTLSAIRCVLKHINVRKEGNEEDGLELANDLKFSLTTRADVALKALGAKGLISALHDKDDNLLCPTIKALHFSLEMDSHCLQIDDGALTLGNVKLKTFVLELSGPGPEADLTFIIQVHPSPKEQAKIAEMLREEVVLTITPPNTLPGVAKAGTISVELTKKDAKTIAAIPGKNPGKDAKLICPDCHKPILKAIDGVQASAMDKSSPRIHRACFRIRINKKPVKKATKKKATKKK